MEVKKDKSEKKFKKDILVKYLYYNNHLICNDPEKENCTIKKIKIRPIVFSIFAILRECKNNEIKRNIPDGKVYYNLEDFDNTCDNIKDTIYDKKKSTFDFNKLSQTNIDSYIDVFFIELFGKYNTDMQYNFNKKKFNDYFKYDEKYKKKDVYCSDDTELIYSEKDMEQKVNKINELEKDNDILRKNLERCNKEKENLRKQTDDCLEEKEKFEDLVNVTQDENENLKKENLELNKKIEEIMNDIINKSEKQTQEFKQLKDSLKEKSK